ncbi:MAG: hypothetical protein EOP56_13715 [Sphingobacteriales bacterium]|nr:MAG: hypothetical protein EOP56_13715 [Sphingobacteriales bacterium]
MTGNDKNNRAIHRLTALWALCESGLGGWLHALKIPLTGFLVGGFAVVIISLLAHYSRNNFKAMMQSLSLVLLVKFTASPHSPGPAYIAVAFQGVIGALLYRIIPSFSIASVVFAITAMVESATQKLLVMTLIFGKSIWAALDGLYNSINKDFGGPDAPSFSMWVIGVYIAVYAVWGLLIGLWIAGLPRRIEQQSAAIRDQFHTWKSGSTEIPVPARKRKNKLLFLLLILVMIVTVFLTANITNGTDQAYYIIARTLLVLLLLFGVVNPLLKWALQRWAGNKKSKAELQSLLDMMPELRGYIAPSYHLAKMQHNGLKRYTAFLMILIVITLQPTNEH